MINTGHTRITAGSLEGGVAGRGEEPPGPVGLHRTGRGRQCLLPERRTRSRESTRLTVRAAGATLSRRAVSFSRVPDAAGRCTGGWWPRSSNHAPRAGGRRAGTGPGPIPGRRRVRPDAIPYTELSGPGRRPEGEPGKPGYRGLTSADAAAVSQPSASSHRSRSRGRGSYVCCRWRAVRVRRADGDDDPIRAPRPVSAPRALRFLRCRDAWCAGDGGPGRRDCWSGDPCGS